MRATARRCVWVAGLALLAGCGGASCPTFPETNAAAAMARANTNRNTVRSLRAEARVEQWGKKGRIRGTVLLFVERPNHIRFDVLTQFGPASILTSDGGTFALTDVGENKMVEGPTCASNIERLLGIPLAGDDIAKVLLGETPELPGANAAIECTGDGTYRVTETAPTGDRKELTLAIDERDVKKPAAEQRLTLIKARFLDSKGKVVWRATFEDYRSVAAKDGIRARMPFDVHVEHLVRHSEMWLTFKDIDLNVTVPEGVFQQTPRPGMPVTEAICE